jgi:raffinose/stachyose/melibiose transport system substrate-binding protein
LHNQPPRPENEQAQTFFELSQAHTTDILWDLPSGLPDGNLIMQQGAIAILDGQSTPREAANALQNGMAQWYEPAQLCGQR